VEITFSTAIVVTASDGATTDLTRVYLTKDGVTDTIVPIVVTRSPSGTVLINPTADLEPGTNYFVTWDALSLFNEDGDSAAAVSDATILNFTTFAPDTTAPVITGSASVSRTAPSTEVATYSSEAGVTWSISGDTSRFEITSEGVVRFKAASTAGTYQIDVEATDAAGNKGTFAVTVTVTAAPDTTAPTLSAVSITGTTQTGTSFKFTPSEAGTYFFLVYAATDAAPSAATIKAQGTAVTKSTAAATATAMTVAITGLTAATSYKIYLVVEDAASNISTVSTTSVTTSAASSGGGGSGGGGTVVAPPVQAPIAAPVAVPQITRSEAFAANSAKLNKDLRVSIREALASNPNAKSAVCRGFVASATATAADRKLARDRSTAVCNLITKLNPDLDVEVKKVMVASSSKQLRKVRMVLR
jgi:hypothetical protein